MSIFHQVYIRSRAYTLRGALNEGARECIIFKRPEIDDVCLIVKVYTFELCVPDAIPALRNAECVGFDEVAGKKSSIIFLGVEPLPSKGSASISGMGVVPENQWGQVLSSIMNVKANDPKDYFKSGTFVVVPNLSEDDSLMHQLERPFEATYKKLLADRKRRSTKFIDNIQTLSFGANRKSK